MNTEATDVRHPPMRSDLQSLVVAGKRRAHRIVSDGIGGRFAKVSEHVWQQLQNGHADSGLWREATAAGWTRTRHPRRSLSWNPLAIKIPLGSIDGIARRIAPIGGFVFSTPAVVLWTMFILIAMVLVLGQWNEWVTGLGSLSGFLRQSDPVLAAAVFATTKLIHELAHAVMCRRVGSRCGGFGVLLLCGVPCPYCDVTDVWRQASAAKRVAVMMAGIYVELILAALSSMVWLFAHDPAIRFGAMNVMVICGISTIVFNANPLMKYDGYYALCDLIGSANLRDEAKSAFASTVTNRVAGRGYPSGRRSDLRSVMLSVYHVAALLYRFVVSIAIAALVVGAAEIVGLRSVAILLVLVFAVSRIRPLIRSVHEMVAGCHRWEHVSRARRGFVLTWIGAILLAVLFTPVPRYRRATGTIDASSAVGVYVASEGIVDEVFADFGDRVRPGQVLVQVHNEILRIDEARAEGRWNLARLRGKMSRHVDLDRSTGATSSSHWPALEAEEDAAQVRLASSRQRVAETKVTARQDGILLPPARIASPDTSEQSGLTAISLYEREGLAVDRHTPWCRISSDGKLHAVLNVRAVDREQIGIGSPVKISLSWEPSRIITSEVVAISEIHDHGEDSFSKRTGFEVLCRMPSFASEPFLSRIGARCVGVFPLPKQSLASYLIRSLGDWVGE